MEEEVNIAELIRKLATGENHCGVTLTQMECAKLLDRLGDDLPKWSALRSWIAWAMTWFMRH